MQREDRQLQSTRKASGLDAILNLLISIDRRLSRIADGVTDNPSSIVINPDQSYTRRQTARLLRVSTWTIDKARKEGVLVEARRIGQRDVRITGDSLLTFMKKKDLASVRVQKM
jgi:hypothetical protein